MVERLKNQRMNEISRRGHGYKVLAGPEATARSFNFTFAGGFIGGGSSLVGTFEVWCSHDNGEEDPFEQLIDVNGDPVTVTTIAGKKSELPSVLFNCGWTKLIGASGEVLLTGVG